MQHSYNTFGQCADTPAYVTWHIPTRFQLPLLGTLINFAQRSAWFHTVVFCFNQQESPATTAFTVITSIDFPVSYRTLSRSSVTLKGTNWKCSFDQQIAVLYHRTLDLSRAAVVGGGIGVFFFILLSLLLLLWPYLCTVRLTLYSTSKERTNQPSSTFFILVDTLEGRAQTSSYFLIILWCSLPDKAYVFSALDPLPSSVRYYIQYVFNPFLPVLYGTVLDN